MTLVLASDTLQVAVLGVTEGVVVVVVPVFVVVVKVSFGGVDGGTGAVVNASSPPEWAPPGLVATIRK
jgi:hypothetical protein